MHAYSNPKRADDPHALPDVEVFYHDGTHDRGDCFSAEYQRDVTGDPDAEAAPTGWYWWPCFPGCFPDGDPIGPFATEAEALADAQAGADDDDVEGE